MMFSKRVKSLSPSATFAMAQKSNELKDIIEEEITQKLGEENMKLIKKLLECEWIK